MLTELDTATDTGGSSVLGDLVHLVEERSLVEGQGNGQSSRGIELDETHTNSVGGEVKGVGQVLAKLNFSLERSGVDGTRFIKDQNDILFLGALRLRAVGRSGRERITSQTNNVKEVESFAVSKSGLANIVLGIDGN